MCIGCGDEESKRFFASRTNSFGTKTVTTQKCFKIYEYSRKVILGLQGQIDAKYGIQALTIHLKTVSFIYEFLKKGDGVSGSLSSLKRRLERIKRKSGTQTKICRRKTSGYMFSWQRIRARIWILHTDFQNLDHGMWI